MVKKTSGDEGYRSFTVIKVGKHGSCKTKGTGGRFINKTPAGAARKAFTELCRIKRIRGVCTLLITIQETTNGSACKVFTYKLNRIKLKKPLIRLEGTNNEFVIEYETNIKSTDIPEDCRNPGQSRGRKKKKTSRKNRISVSAAKKLSKHLA